MSKTYSMGGKQCRPWSDAAFCSIWSGSTLFAQASLSQYTGLLQYLNYIYHLIIPLFGDMHMAKAWCFSETALISMPQPDSLVIWQLILNWFYMYTLYMHTYTYREDFCVLCMWPCLNWYSWYLGDCFKNLFRVSPSFDVNITDFRTVLLKFSLTVFKITISWMHGWI